MAKKQSKKKARFTPNIQNNITLKQNEPFSIVPVKFARDLRLSHGTLGILVRLMSLPLKWELKIKKSAFMFGVSINTLKTALNELEKNHYITRVRAGSHNYFYQLTTPYELDESPFNPLYIKTYSQSQLEYFYTSKALKEEYKAFIRAFWKLQKDKGIITEKELDSLLRKYCPTDYDYIDKHGDELF